jgi:hypothetical protein
VKPLEDPKNTMDIILEALKDTGQRGIVDQGWGDLGNCKCFPSSFSYACLQILITFSKSHV